MLNRSIESGHSCICWKSLEEKFLVFTTVSDVIYGLFIHSLCYVVVISFCSCVLSVLITSVVLNLSWAFSASIEMIMWCFSLHCVNVVCRIDVYSHVESSLQSMDKVHLVMVCIIFLMCCLIFFLEFCWGFLHLYSLELKACSFWLFFLWYLCLTLASW